MKKSIYRIITAILGILHLLPLFVLPYAKLEGLLGGLGQLAGALGVGDSYPEKLTGLAILRLSGGMGVEASGVIMVLVLLPALSGFLITIMMLIGKSKVSYIVSILFSMISAGVYGLMAIFLSDFSSYGYQVGVIHFLFLGIEVLQAAIAVIGIKKEKTEVFSESHISIENRDGAETCANEENYDGVIFGITGTYEGASIPIKIGETIVIGRDPASCGIVIKDEKASRKHCRIFYHGMNGTYSVTDISSNGVYDENGKRLPQNTEILMEAGSEIRIGRDGDVFRFG